MDWDPRWQRVHHIFNINQATTDEEGVFIPIESVSYRSAEYVESYNNNLAGTSYDSRVVLAQSGGGTWGNMSIVSNTNGEDGSGAGHAWIELSKPGGASMTVSLWGNKGKQELWYNLEKGRPQEVSRTRSITNAQFNKLTSYLSNSDNVDWTAWNTCAGFSSAIWNYTTGESLSAQDNFGFTTPRQLQQSITNWNKFYPIKP